MERKIFDSIEQITDADVAWLKEGSYRRDGYIYNDHVIDYRTRRGVCKSMTCYVFANGFVKWRSYTGTGNVKDGLTKEEMRYFEPEKYARQHDRQVAKKAEQKAKAINNPIKVGDIFKGSYGYEAWIHEYYEVVDVSKSGKSVTVRELAQERENTGWSTWNSRPIKGKYVGKRERHTVNFDGKPSFRVNSHMRAYLHENPEQWDSAYNYH